MRATFQRTRTCMRELLLIGACAALSVPGSVSGARPNYENGGQAEAAVSKAVWKGNKIVSRVLPYSDFVSLFVRLPIAHCAANGRGVKIAVLACGDSQAIVQQVRDAAPQADIIAVACGASDTGEWQIHDDPAKLACRVALIAEPNLWPSKSLVETVQKLIAAKSAVVVPSDLSERQEDIDTVKRVHELGCLTVGRVGRQSMLFNQVDQKSTPFNPMIRSIETDVFSTVGQLYPPVDPAATAAGVAALVAQKKPNATPAQIRAAIVQGARKAWQATSFENQGMSGIVVDPVTTEYRVLDEGKIYRFRVLDAAGALGVDTEIPWFLNMMNCQEAWKITKGKGTTVVISDQGFHIKHPALASAMIGKEHFGTLDFNSPDQNFHGTDMSRILLAVAPEAKIVPVLCSDGGQQKDEFASNIARSFEYAAKVKADVVSASWAGYFNADQKLVEAIKCVVDQGVLVSWFHYPKPYPGLLRSTVTYLNDPIGDKQLGFADRFLTDPPGFHPVEIEAGLSGTAPQAAGLAALLKSVNPKLKPADIERILLDTATPLSGKVVIPDAYKAVLAAKSYKG